MINLKKRVKKIRVEGPSSPSLHGAVSFLVWIRQAGEKPLLGLILCAGKKRETVELLSLEESGIGVAEYLTALPPRAVLAGRLHRAIEHARARFQHRLSGDDPPETL